MKISWLEWVFIVLIAVWALREEVKWHKKFNYLRREGFTRKEARDLMQQGKTTQFHR